MGEGSTEQPNDEPQESRFDDIMRYIAAGSVILGGALGLWQYFDTAQKSYRQPLWDRQITVYFEAANTVGLMAATDEPAIREKAEKDFWRLFYGPMALIQDHEVELAMIDVAKCIKADCDQGMLRPKSLHLAHTCRRSLGESWSVKLPELQAKTAP